MVICSCNVLTDREINAALSSSSQPRTPGAVYKCLGCTPNCGRCFATIKALIRQHQANSSEQDFPAANKISEPSAEDCAEPALSC
jgi:bacterioferritin-associated ferredoxin